MNFFNKLGLRIQIAFGAIIGLIGVIIFFLIKGKIMTKKNSDLELKRAEAEKEIAGLKEESEESYEKIEVLSKEEIKIRENILLIKEKEIKSEEVSLEELDKFFDDRDL